VETVATHFAPLAETLEAELMHARVREALAPAAGQADGTVGRWRGAGSRRLGARLLLLLLWMLLIPFPLPLLLRLLLLVGLVAALAAALREIRELNRRSWQCDADSVRC